MKRIVISILIATYPLFTQAEIYKCENLNGRKVFQSMPCERDPNNKVVDRKPAPETQAKSTFIGRTKEEQDKCWEVRSNFVLAFLRENGNVRIGSLSSDRPSSALNNEVTLYCGTPSSLRSPSAIKSCGGKPLKQYIQVINKFDPKTDAVWEVESQLLRLAAEADTECAKPRISESSNCVTADRNYRTATRKYNSLKAKGLDRPEHLGVLMGLAGAADSACGDN